MDTYPPPQDLQLAETIRLALLEKQNQLRLGATTFEAEENFEKTIRAAWPFTREWHYLCDDCDDTGLSRHRCTARWRCGEWSTAQPATNMKDPAHWRKRRCADQGDDYEHEYVQFCGCRKGQAMRSTYDNTYLRKNREDEFTDAGKVPKRPSRFGQ